MLRKKGQSILEYSILLAVVIAVLLIMQAFVKRGYQGSLKTSSEKMGEQFSASSTTIKEEQAMAGDQNIITEVGTTTDMMNQFSDRLPQNVAVKGTLDKGAYSLNTRQGGVVTATTQHNTASAQQEKARLSDYANDDVANYTDPVLTE